ncbi:MAG: chorismate synthase [Nitratireductor sp.]
MVDGCPPGIRFTIAGIQAFLDKRKPGRSGFYQREEPDAVEVLSGIMPDDKARESDYHRHADFHDDPQYRSALKVIRRIRDRYRPGHADHL